MYMEDLQVLNSMTPPLESAKLPERFTRVVTPLKSEVWERYLQALPDKECAQYMVNGLSQGFRVGFNYRVCTYSSARCNMLSDLLHPKVIDDYLQEEVERGRILGPIDPTLL